jgi:hypothetical protein
MFPLLLACSSDYIIKRGGDLKPKQTEKRNSSFTFFQKGFIRYELEIPKQVHEQILVTLDVAHNNEHGWDPYDFDEPIYEYSGVQVFCDGLNVYNYQLEKFMENGVPNKNKYNVSFQKTFNINILSFEIPLQKTRVLEFALGAFRNLDDLSRDKKELQKEEYTLLRFVALKVFNNDSHFEYYAPGDKGFDDKPIDYNPSSTLPY